MDIEWSWTKVSAGHYKGFATSEYVSSPRYYDVKSEKTGWALRGTFEGFEYPLGIHPSLRAAKAAASDDFI